MAKTLKDTVESLLDQQLKLGEQITSMARRQTRLRAENEILRDALKALTHDPDILIKEMIGEDRTVSTT